MPRGVALRMSPSAGSWYGRRAPGGTVPSAVLAAELPGFLAKLQAGLELQGDQVSPPPPVKEPGGGWEDEAEPREQPIKLRLRAVPLLDMLNTAIRQQSDLLWEKA